MSASLNLNDQWVIEAAVRRVLADACKPGGVLRQMVAEELHHWVDEESQPGGVLNELFGLVEGTMNVLLEATESPEEAESLRRHLAHRQLLEG